MEKQKENNNENNINDNDDDLFIPVSTYIFESTYNTDLNVNEYLKYDGFGPYNQNSWIKGLYF